MNPKHESQISILKKEDHSQRIRRRQDCDLISQWTFSYFQDYLKIGNKRELKAEDFPEVEDEDKAQIAAESIHKEWKLEQELHGEKASFTRALWRVFGPRYAVAGICFLIEFMVQLTQGWFLSRLLNSIADGNQSSYTYWYAAGLVFDQSAYTFLHHWEWWITIRTGMQIRVGLIAAIYKKITNLSLANVPSTGFIVNLVSNDVQRFEDASPFLHYCWVTPLQIIGYMTLIYYEIGWSMFAAVGCIGLIVPLQFCFGRFFKKYRKITVDFRDERIKCISDMIAGIQIVKLYAWEIPFIKKINEWRDAEMGYIWKGNFLKAINESIFFSSGVFVNALTFILYHYLGGELTPAKIFSTIVYLNILKLSITNFVPKSFQFVSECAVSLDRLQEFFSLPEAEIVTSDQNLSGSSETACVFKNVSLSWKNDTGKPTLQNITMSIKKGELILICGSVGAGKSSFLHAILGDMFLIEGKLSLFEKKIAYVPQTPWILSGSIKDNILFGQPYDDERFKKAIHAACLEKDFQSFPKGASTFIGERGITLSGGQRARISLARAVYSDAEIFLLDDPLSAVDTKVGRFLFEQCISSSLKGKTILLVTHQLQFLSGADKVVVFDHGLLAQFGTYQEITESGSSFAESVRLYAKQQKEEKSVGDEIGEDNNESFITQANEDDFAKEEVFKGSVSFSTYYRYFTEGISKPLAIILPILLLSSQTFSVLADFWLSKWSSLSDQSSSINSIVLFSLAIATLVLSILRAILFFVVSFNSSKNSFRKMMDRVFRAPMGFFQSNPNGRIMNRFSKDMNLMDETLPQVFFDLVQCAILTFAVFVVAAIIMPYALILFPFITILLLKLRNYYMNASRQIKRIEAISRSPVYSAIPSTLEGLSIIRAFKAKERFNSEFFSHQDNNTRMFFGFISSGRWLGMRLDGMSAAISGIIIFSVLALRNYLGISSASVGLLISYLIQMTGTMQWAVRQSSEVENLMVSVERVLEYTELEPEEDPNQLDPIQSLSPDWPHRGKISLKDASLQYPDIQNPGQMGQPVLKNLSITIDAGLKVGIVGRTGAGKSSLLQALFRLVEPSPKGCIKIDDISTSDLPLSTLRSRISIIPQEPFCFKGTLRFNLDPFNQFSDDELWSVLEAIELKKTVIKTLGKLDAVVEENGSNWSIGERQLICLSRAILRNSNLLVMDEATSSIDLQTDQSLQKAIRGLFKNATVLTIAHRLNSVIDFDRILVLDQGRIVEFGSPKDLLSKDKTLPDAWFSKMVSEMGDAARSELLHLAK